MLTRQEIKEKAISAQHWSASNGQWDNEAVFQSFLDDIEQAEDNSIVTYQLQLELYRLLGY